MKKDFLVILVTTFAIVFVVAAAVFSVGVYYNMSEKPVIVEKVIVKEDPAPIPPAGNCFISDLVDRLGGGPSGAAGAEAYGGSMHYHSAN